MAFLGGIDRAQKRTRVSEGDEMRGIKGKIALVTGGARGIGRGIAVCLAEEGADVILVDRSPGDAAKEAADAIEALGQKALVLSADVADREAMQEVFAESVAKFGRIDIAVANAGYSVRELTIDAHWEDVLRTIEVTQFGVYHMCQLAAQQMVKQREGSGVTGCGGKIIITGSIHEQMPVATSAPYNMAKAAVNHLCRTLANELAEYRINVNTINPGWIDTPGERRYVSEDTIREEGKKLPWGRMGTPEDIGRAAAFLASDDADYITGTSLKVDGGFILSLKRGS